MRTLKNSTIYFKNSDGIYRPGDTLSGRIEINLNSTKTIRALFYEVIGKASVYWSESESVSNSDGTTSTSSTSYSNEEIYFKEKFYLVGKEKTDEKIEIPSGQHVFSFNYLLPSNLPPTFKGIDGKIIYSVKATLDRPWKINKNVEAPFIIETLANVQDNPKAKEPVRMSVEKQFGVVFKSKPLKLIVKVPYSGFAPGQIIPIRLEIMNESSNTVNKISVKLKQITVFHATSKDNRTLKTLAKNPILFQIKPKSSNSFNHSLHVPVDVTSHDLSKCKIIDMDHEIMVELHTSGLTKNLVANVPFYPIKTSP